MESVFGDNAFMPPHAGPTAGDQPDPAEALGFDSAAPDSVAIVHPSAEIEPGTRIGAGTRIWRRAHVRSGAVIGAGCNIGANVFIDSGVRIGDRVKVQNNVSVYEGVELADESFVGPAAVFTNDRNPRATGEWQLARTFVGPGASVGANATVVCGVELGEHSLVGAGAVVTRSVAPHQLVLGNPARPGGWVCRCGVVVSRDAQRPSALRCADCPHADSAG